MTEPGREEFEKWSVGRYRLEKYSANLGGEYQSDAAEFSWEAWTAGRAPLVEALRVTMDALESIAKSARDPMNSRDAGYVISSDSVLERCEEALDRARKEGI